MSKIGSSVSGWSEHDFMDKSIDIYVTRFVKTRLTSQKIDFRFFFCVFGQLNPPLSHDEKNPKKIILDPLCENTAYVQNIDFRSFFAFLVN